MNVFLLQRSLSYVLRRTDISRTPDSATNTTTATMASPRRGCVPMGWCSTPSPGRGSLVTTTSTWTAETDSTSVSIQFHFYLFPIFFFITHIHFYPHNT